MAYRHTSQSAVATVHVSDDEVLGRLAWAAQAGPFPTVSDHPAQRLSTLVPIPEARLVGRLETRPFVLVEKAVHGIIDDREVLRFGRTDQRSRRG